jgi:hypothetical protein
MSKQIYGMKAALDLFESAGAKMSRQTFDEQVLPHLVKSGFAEKHGASWAFDKRYLQHWSEYAAEAIKRRADGRLPYHYAYSEGDMQDYIDGAWDE